MIIISALDSSDFAEEAAETYKGEHSAQAHCQ